jgi:hypothetical protein
MRIAMRGNWWGLAGQRVYRLFGHITKNEVISGIPASDVHHGGVPYSLTEEFVSVYRMHPLMPDDFTFRSIRDDAVLQERSFPEVAFDRARAVVEQIPMTDLWYSFGTMHPGAITLHNYPRSLQQLRKPDGTLHDLAATDIVRTRERGVPRYNQFRRLFHRRPVSGFEEITDNPAWAEEMRRVYDNDVEQVDLVVGLYAETPPRGFAFSDTAFRVFLLMASRRLSSDRFFTTDFTPTVYTQTGLDWIEENDMTSVLLRHFPRLAPSLRHVKNPFAPWTRVGR